MENLRDFLPICLIELVEEYSKDRSKYDEVLDQFDTLNCLMWMIRDKYYASLKISEILLKLINGQNMYYKSQKAMSCIKCVTLSSISGKSLASFNLKD